ncbi:hypothetical protein K438DRAFT_1748060 [Mycena galopus ATCC 62051]|nr:hypothetical protein K438DRAFT_1748060 [Mycena galopus ATCC 62051]
MRLPGASSKNQYVQLTSAGFEPVTLSAEEERAGGLNHMPRFTEFWDPGIRSQMFTTQVLTPVQPSLSSTAPRDVVDGMSPLLAVVKVLKRVLNHTRVSVPTLLPDGPLSFNASKITEKRTQAWGWIADRHFTDQHPDAILNSEFTPSPVRYRVRMWIRKKAKCASGHSVYISKFDIIKKKKMSMNRIRTGPPQDVVDSELSPPTGPIRHHSRGDLGNLGDDSFLRFNHTRHAPRSNCRWMCG